MVQEARAQLQPFTTRMSGWGANLHADCVLREPENEAHQAITYRELYVRVNEFAAG